MIQLLQSLSTGRTDLIDAPVPGVSASGLVIEGRCSLVSAGTERMLIEFGRAGWVEKARRQPDKVAQVLNKARTDGVAATLDAVRSKLETPIPLGYCHAGVVTEVGSASLPFVAGDRVVSNGTHAEYVAVPWTLAARIPDEVSFEAAAFTPVAAIGLQGIRLAAPTLGETVVVYGLGLIGLLSVQLLRANGCRVLGIDTNADRLALAGRLGAEPLPADGDVAARVLAATGGVGADAVLLTLASPSDEPVHHAAVMSRKRGRIVLVGVTGLNIRRDDFYKKELSFSVSCSYGPGRYDAEYEDAGRDYPLPYVRWTEQRNFEAVLQLMASGAVNPLPLITHRFPFHDAPRAYELIVSAEPSLGVLLEYAPRSATSQARARTLALPSRPAGQPATTFAVGVIGAGNFGSRILIPAMVANGARLRTIASRTGTSAAVTARRFGFEQVTSDVEGVFSDAAVDTVVILTRHDSHATLVLRALEAGKHVFVEKPLALTEADLDRIEGALAATDRTLTVGFNRRFAPLARTLQQRLADRSGPAALIITVNAGAIPGEHWTQNPETGGGRIVGEACHFVDLARFLVGAPIADLQAMAAARHGRPQDDVAHLSLAFADGSTAVVHYLANGSAAFPKERIEVFADGRIWRIDNWRRLQVFGASGGQGHSFSRMEKGHREELAAFARSVRAAQPPPIPYEELFEVSRWAIRAADLARASPANRRGSTSP
jgi:predicted dehydrogenase/NADPH:quinone reductase-like Zn-dependent oxidoreductase